MERLTKHRTTFDSRRKSLDSQGSKQDDKDAAVTQLEADQAQTFNIRKQLEAPMRVARAALDSRTWDAPVLTKWSREQMSGSRWTLRCATQNLVGRCVTRTPQSRRTRRRRRGLSLTLLKRRPAPRERGAILHGRRMPRCLRSSTVLEKAATDFNRRQPAPIAVSKGGRRQAGSQGRHEGSQPHRGSCRAAGEEVSKERLTTPLTL